MVLVFRLFFKEGDNIMGNLFRSILVQVLVASAFSIVDESVRTVVREKVKRTSLCPQGSTLGG